MSVLSSLNSLLVSSATRRTSNCLGIGNFEIDNFCVKPIQTKTKVFYFYFYTLLKLFCNYYTSCIPQSCCQYTNMDDSNPLARTANLLEEIDSESSKIKTRIPSWFDNVNKWMIYKICLFYYRKINGVATRRKNTHRLPAKRWPVCELGPPQDHRANPRWQRIRRHPARYFYHSRGKCGSAGRNRKHSWIS